jgi:hypothetical protein
VSGFLAVAGDFMTIQGNRPSAREANGRSGATRPDRVLPDWMVRLVSLFDKSVGLIVPELGKFKNATNEKVRRMLWLGAAFQRRLHHRDRRELGAAWVRVPPVSVRICGRSLRRATASWEVSGAEHGDLSASMHDDG